MSLASDLVIGGVTVSNDDSAHDLTITREHDGGATYRVRGSGALEKLSGPRAGKHKLSISASGPFPPALGSVNWSAAVSVVFTDLATDDGTTAMSILSDGPKEVQDIRRVVTGWTLEGREV